MASTEVKLGAVQGDMDQRWDPRQEIQIRDGKQKQKGKKKYIDLRVKNSRTVICMRIERKFSTLE
jgi:hypothetical protein